MPPVSLALRSGKPVPSAVMRSGWWFPKPPESPEISRVPFFRFYVKIFGGVYIYIYQHLQRGAKWFRLTGINSPSLRVKKWHPFDGAGIVGCLLSQQWSVVEGRRHHLQSKWWCSVVTITGKVGQPKKLMLVGQCFGFAGHCFIASMFFGSFHVIETSAVNQDISTKTSSQIKLKAWFVDIGSFYKGCHESSPLTTCFRCVLACMMGSIYSTYLLA